MNFNKNKPPKILDGHTDTRWTDSSIYNNYNSPIEFMNDVIAQKNNKWYNEDGYITQGIAKYKKIQEKDDSYDTLYEDVASKVKDKLLSRGFTTSMLYSTVEFTSENTGVMSKQRAMLGKRDCFFKNPAVADGKLFHDIYINLSYPYSVRDSTIVENSYAVYALTRELSRVLPMRVIVVNHTGHYGQGGICYSYILKQFGVPIKPKEFLFFLSDSKRTFGWATYSMLQEGSNSASVGEPTGTVSIAQFNLDKVIDEVFLRVKAVAPSLFKMV